jgi:hypothetical protein
MAKLLKAVSFIFVAIFSIYIPYTQVIKGIQLYYSGSTPEKVLVQKADADIAVFGSSVAWVHFDPSIIESLTGRSCLNFGLDGAVLQQYNGLLKEFMQYSKGRIIILAGTSNEFTNRESIYEFEKFYSWLDNENIYESLSAIDFDLTWRSRYVPMYSITTFDGDIYEKSLDGFLGKTYTVKNEEHKGFSPKNRPWKSQVNKSDFVVEINRDVVQQYREVISTANKKNKKVILVLAPIYINGQRQIKNLDEVRKIYKKLAGEKNTFLDFTKSQICNDRSYFYNNLHLNAIGADLFTQEFSKKLVELGISN